MSRKAARAGTVKKYLAMIVVLVLVGCSPQPILASGGWPSNVLDWNRSSTAGEGVRIAVVDTGISSASFTADRLAEGKNYLLQSTDTTDRLGHGTALAGILLGLPAKQLPGVAPAATLVPLVYFSKNETGLPIDGGTKGLAQAIADAVDQFDCRVILISAGTTEDAPVLRQAIELAEQQGAVVVAPVGNNQDDSPESVYFPAAYETVIGVAALREDGDIATFSQRNTTVSLCAPGTNLRVATIQGRTIKDFGTSYAAAFVAGAAAQILSEYPALTPAQVRSALCTSALDIGTPGYDTDSGYGKLQINAARSVASQLAQQNTHENFPQRQRIILFTSLTLASLMGTAVITMRRIQHRR